MWVQAREPDQIGDALWSNAAGDRWPSMVKEISPPGGPTFGFCVIFGPLVRYLLCRKRLPRRKSARFPRDKKNGRTSFAAFHICDKGGECPRLHPVAAPSTPFYRMGGVGSVFST